MWRYACALVAIVAVVTGGAALAEDKAEKLHKVHPPECLQSSVWFLDHGPSFTGLPVLSEPAVDAPLVAIVDTAFDLLNPMLRYRWAAGHDFVDGDADPGLPPYLLARAGRLIEPGLVHGTMVASVV